jgi:methylmalonyl-CoA mutase cobalamin-binding subunit
MGVGELFTPGTSTVEIVKFLNEWVAKNPRN